jgi:hypothetical protein
LTVDQREYERRVAERIEAAHQAQVRERRERIACAALPGVLAHGRVRDQQDAAIVAEEALRIADALIKELGP